jgi:exodeoxyribonuclease VII large subunit
MARAGQRLEALDHRLRRSILAGHVQRSERILNLGRRLGTALAARRHLESERQAAYAHRLGGLDQRLKRALSLRLDGARERVARLDQLLRSLSYTQVLSRGFALVRDADGMPLRRAAQVTAGARLDLEFADGHRSAIAEDGAALSEKKSVREPAKSRDASVKKTSQGSLF